MRDDASGTRVGDEVVVRESGRGGRRRRGVARPLPGFFLPAPPFLLSSSPPRPRGREGPRARRGRRRRRVCALLARQRGGRDETTREYSHRHPPRMHDVSGHVDPRAERSIAPRAGPHVGVDGTHRGAPHGVRRDARRRDVLARRACRVDASPRASRVRHRRGRRRLARGRRRGGTPAHPPRRTWTRARASFSSGPSSLRAGSRVHRHDARRSARSAAPLGATPEERARLLAETTAAATLRRARRATARSSRARATSAPSSPAPRVDASEREFPRGHRHHRRHVRRRPLDTSPTTTPTTSPSPFGDWRVLWRASNTSNRDFEGVC